MKIYLLLLAAAFFALTSLSQAKNLPIRYTIPPNTNSLITLKTLPDSVCTVHIAGDRDKKNSFKLFADQEGLIQFYIKPGEATLDIDKYIIDCKVDGKTTHYSLELRTASNPTADLTAPAKKEAFIMNKNWSTRPALKDSDCKNLTDKELLKNGYPPRPDMKKNPQFYGFWKKAVMMPVNFFEPYTVKRTDIKVRPLKSVKADGLPVTNINVNAQTGYTLAAKNGTFNMALGLWYVPTVTGEGFQKPTTSEMLVYLDGNTAVDPKNTNGLMAGTEQDAFTIRIGTRFINVAQYFPCILYLPQQNGVSQVTDFSVAPGDEIFTEVWVGNPGAYPSVTGSNAMFYIEDFTTRQSVTVPMVLGSTHFLGAQASWVMQDPYNDLANFGTAKMFFPIDTQQGSSAVTMNVMTMQGVDAINNQLNYVTLATCANPNFYTYTYTFKNFH